MVLMVLMVQSLSAQIRIIPQQERLEMTQPKVAASPLRLLQERLNFGTIDEMSGVWQGSATLVNSGEKSIAIVRIKSTCGCLQADIPKRVLAPRERVSMSLKYYPRGHAGKVNQRLFIYTDSSSESPSAVLTFTGVVTASADRSDDYPYQRGALRLRQERVVLDGKRRQSVRIACMNGGTTTLRLSCDELLSSQGVKVRFEPATLAPKQEGDMIVEYDPAQNSRNLEMLKAYIKGLNLPPREGVVEVKIEK